MDVVVTHGDEERTLTVTTVDNNGWAHWVFQPTTPCRPATVPQTASPRGRLAAGATIVDVVADSPAATAGVQAGDVICRSTARRSAPATP